MLSFLFHTKYKKKTSDRRWKTWSSGYGMRLAIWGLWVRIPAPGTVWIFFHKVVRVAMFVWKDERKRKRGRGWPILEKTSDKYETVKLMFAFVISNGPFPAYFLYFVFLTVNKYKSLHKLLPAGLDPMSSDVGSSNCSADCATTSAPFLWLLFPYKTFAR